MDFFVEIRSFPDTYKTIKLKSLSEFEKIDFTHYGTDTFYLKVSSTGFTAKGESLILNKFDIDLRDYYLVNFKKCVYIDLAKLPEEAKNPLFLLCYEDNDSGEFNYTGFCEDYVGSWANEPLKLYRRTLLNLADIAKFCKKIYVNFEV
jgi:hypothetical protein